MKSSTILLGCGLLVVLTHLVFSCVMLRRELACRSLVNELHHEVKAEDFHSWFSADRLIEVKYLFSRHKFHFGVFPSEEGGRWKSIHVYYWFEKGTTIAPKI